ncbi:hypothetical protein ACTHPJ_24085 [Paenibacillus amylolyticus]|uniref:hypothetical protein n=1 Tax=Paenibacillus amylolyticus TaxID=1451 RepID=UPI003F7F3FEB
MSSNEQNEIEEHYKSFAFSSELHKESDRGCVLLATAYLDECLKQLLEANTVDDKGVFENLSSGTGGLATFSSRIDLSYLLGLISPETRRHLTIIRKIRNEFAHTMEFISLETESVANRCRCLRTDDFYNVPDKARETFIRASFGIAGSISGATNSSKKPKAASDERKMNFKEWKKTEHAQQLKKRLQILKSELNIDK